MQLVRGVLAEWFEDTSMDVMIRRRADLRVKKRKSHGNKANNGNVRGTYLEEVVGAGDHLRLVLFHDVFLQLVGSA